MAKHSAPDMHQGLQQGVRLILLFIAIIAALNALSGPDERRRRAEGEHQFRPGRHRAVRGGRTVQFVRRLAAV